MSAVSCIVSCRRRRNKLIIFRKYLRDTMDPFDISEARFIEMYRLPPSICISFIEEIKALDSISMTDYDHEKKIPIHLEILSVLNFLGSGSYQRRVGSDALVSLSQTMVSRCVKKFTRIISTQLGNIYVKFPQTQGEIDSTKLSFYREYNFPNIIGLIDGTHIAITGLKRHIENAYVNRKRFHSINVQLICDNNLLILNCNPRYPGSTHDSFIWSNSNIFSLLEAGLEEEGTLQWLLGDSGYSLQPFLLTPIHNPATAGEQNYNYVHRKIRSKIERCIGLLKNRFRCILGERVLRYDPESAAHIIISCVVLHNILVKNNVIFIDDPISASTSERGHNQDTNSGNSSYFAQGSRNRNWVIEGLQN